MYAFDNIDKSEGKLYSIEYKDENGKEVHAYLEYGKDGEYKIQLPDGKEVKGIPQDKIKINPGKTDYTASMNDFKVLSSHEPTDKDAVVKNYEHYKSKDEALAKYGSEEALQKAVDAGKVAYDTDDRKYRVVYSKEDAINGLLKNDPSLPPQEAEKIINDEINSGRLIIAGHSADQPKTTALPGTGATNLDFHGANTEELDGFAQENHRTKPIGTNSKHFDYDEENFENNLKYKDQIDNHLGNDPNLGKIIEDNDTRVSSSFYTLAQAVDSGGISRNLLGNKDRSKFTYHDYLAHYAASGQRSGKDLQLMLDAQIKAGFIKVEATENFFFNTEFVQIYNDNKDKAEEYAKAANKLIDDVTQIKDEFAKVYNNMADWSGQARGAAKNAVDTVLQKFVVTMANIENYLTPTCDNIIHFVEMLEELKKEDEKLKGKDGAGNDGLLKELTDLGNALDNLIEPAYGTETYTDADGVEKTRPKESDAHKGWRATKTDLEDKIAKKKEEIEAQKLVCAKLLAEVITMYFQIQNYMTTLTSFSQYFISGTTQNKWISSLSSIYDNKDAILEDFHNYKRMPVISNASDYKEEDILFHDDARGIVYKVTKGFNPLTGTMQIGAYDPKTGKMIGKPITVWDPREIAPVEPRPIPSKYPVPPPTTSTTPPPTTSTTPPPPTTSTTPPPPTTTTPPPTPFPPPPPPTTTTPPPTSTEPEPTRTPIIPGPTPTTPEPEPTVPTPTTPEPEPTVPTPTNPNTGLGMYGALEAGGSNLGALAGLAAGAAGLGLTGLMGDKKEEKEDTVEKHEEKKDDNKEKDSEESKEQKDNELIAKYEEMVRQIQSGNDSE